MDLRSSGVVQQLSGASVCAESRPSTIGPINLGLKSTGKPSAGNPHTGFDAAGAGNQFTARLVRHSQRKRGETDRPGLRSMAPVLDPTCERPVVKFHRPTQPFRFDRDRKGRKGTYLNVFPSTKAVQTRNDRESSVLQADSDPDWRDESTSE